jgi:hypothetical protein
MNQWVLRVISVLALILIVKASEIDDNPQSPQQFKCLLNVGPCDSAGHWLKRSKISFYVK